MRKIDLAIDLRAQNDFADLTSGQDLTFRVHHGLELDLVLEMVGLICPIMIHDPEHFWKTLAINQSCYFREHGD